MYNPVSTYRIQFHKGFTFNHFEKIIPYLQKLGVGAIYASPIFSAVSGSMHGYDGINPLCINPEIGTEEQLREICKKLDESGIGWIQDIVPNHMAFSPDNEWLADVLEKGKKSKWYNYFDIIENPKLDNRLMVPFLGAPLEDAIGKGDLKIAVKNGRLGLQYFDFVYPVKPASYTRILEGENIPDEIRQFTEAAKSGNENLRDWLTSLMGNDLTRSYIEDRLAKINASEKDIIRITGEQEYRLCHWEETNTRINYRRFFTVNSLICLNIQNGEVFNYYHSYIKKLTEEGVFKGLRIDHIDGLYDPTVYLERLRELVG
ncbi:MAG TPA: alpha-amylase family glycosyl hydrolase, partial [Bacteroidia bacterium]|nr:alpha-amylase family glycosyl hydrolase [Bacteroidia bacterium]